MSDIAIMSVFVIVTVTWIAFDEHRRRKRNGHTLTIGDPE